MTSVSLNDVTRAYANFTLGPVSTTFHQGITGLLGANGAGKSTLMRRIVGAERGGGTVVDNHGQPPCVGYLPQDFTAPKRLTAEEYLRFVGWCRSTRQHRIATTEVAATLAAVDLTAKAGTKVGALSGGMLRRLGVAQALIGNPDILVLDEPTVGLDPIQRTELRGLLTGLGGSHVVLISTHLSEDVAAIADSVAILSNGQLAFSGDMTRLLQVVNRTERDSTAVDLAFSTIVGGHSDA